MPQQWQFDQNDDAQWRWKRIDDARGEVDSPATFAREIDCIMDAVRYTIACRRSQTDQGHDGPLQ